MADVSSPAEAPSNTGDCSASRRSSTRGREARQASSSTLVPTSARVPEGSRIHALSAASRAMTGSVTSPDAGTSLRGLDQDVGVRLVGSPSLGSPHRLQRRGEQVGDLVDARVQLLRGPRHDVLATLLRA